MEYLVLVIDDQFMQKQISECLEKEHYKVMGVRDGIEAMDFIQGHIPDLIILEVDLPKIHGCEICRMIRNDTRLSHIPIIILSSKDDPENKVAGLEAGADDYITKPFHPRELIARLRNHLRRAKQEKSFNPLTGLPGNIMIEEEIKTRVTSKQKFAVLYVDLDNFKAFNDVYGFLKGDEIIKYVAQSIKEKVNNLGLENFIGHVGGDDFIVITKPEWVDHLAKTLIDHFEINIGPFYSHEDRQRGHIETKDRRGNVNKFPLMTMSIAVVSNEKRNIMSHWQVGEIAAELKKYAKSLPGSVYVKDRRTD